MPYRLYTHRQRRSRLIYVGILLALYCAPLREYVENTSSSSTHKNFDKVKRVWRVWCVYIIYLVLMHYNIHQTDAMTTVSTKFHELLQLPNERRRIYVRASETKAWFFFIHLYNTCLFKLHIHVSQLSFLFVENNYEFI